MKGYFSQIFVFLVVNTFFETPFAWVCWNLVIAPLAGLGLVTFAHLWVIMLVLSLAYSLGLYLFR